MKWAALLHSKLFLSIFAAVVVSAAVVTGVIVKNQPEAYRVIKIFDISGEGNVSRKNVGDLAPYSGMNLESGDVVSTYTDSNIRMSLDDTKYIRMEPETELEIISSGNPSQNKTQIVLHKGSILNEITQPLSSGSTYEVTAPKATMAVRGTSFRVTVLQDADGNYITLLQTFHGKVEVTLVDEAGNPTDKKVVVEADKSVVIKTVPNGTGDAFINGTSFFVFPGENGYDPVPEGTSPVIDLDYDSVPYGTLKEIYDVNNSEEITLYNVVLKKVIAAMNGEGDTEGVITTTTEATTTTTPAPVTDEETTAAPDTTSGTTAAPETEPPEEETDPVTVSSEGESSSASEGSITPDADEPPSPPDTTVASPETTAAPEITSSPDTTAPEETSAPEIPSVPGSSSSKHPVLENLPETKETTVPPETTTAAPTTAVPDVTSAPVTTTAPSTTPPPQTVPAYVNTSGPADVTTTSPVTDPGPRNADVFIPETTVPPETTTAEETTTPAPETEPAAVSTEEPEDDTIGVTFFDHTGKPIVTQKVKRGESAVEPAIAQSYVNDSGITMIFKGWQQSFKDIEAPVNVFPIYEAAEKYTVTFDSNGGTTVASQTVESGSTASSAETTREGYSFNGWFLGEELYDFSTPVTGDITLTASWTISQYTIAFITDGGTYVAPITLEYGTEVPSVEPPTKEGHEFAGWDTEIPATMPGNNVVITARWKAKQYTITFVTGEGASEISPVTLGYGEAVPAVGTPTRIGYEFTGWDIEIPENMPAENLTATAQWKAKQYTITFVTGEGATEMTPVTLGYGEAVPDVGTPERTGYEFTGWDIEIPKNMPAENLTATAQWSAKQYTITFVTGEGASEISPITLDYGAAISVTDPTRAGYDFTSWEPALPSTMPDSDLSVTAVWTARTDTPYKAAIYRQSLTGIYEHYETIDCTGTTDTRAEPPEKTYEGFTLNSAKTNEVDLVVAADESTVIQVFYDRNAYTLTWDFDGGEAMTGSYTPEGTTMFGAPISYPDETSVKKLGYTLSGWSVSEPVMTDCDLTIKAVWTPNTNTPYTVKHFLENIEDTNYTEDTASEQSLEGTTGGDTEAAALSFTGFTAQDITQKEIAADGTTVVEVYYKRNTYTLTWHPSEDGAEMTGDYTSGEVKFGAPITAPTMSLEGWEFKGWLDHECSYYGEHGGVPVPITIEPKMPPNDLDYYAYFNISSYTVSFENAKGEVFHQYDYQYGASISSPGFNDDFPESFIEGGNKYVFEGWTYEGTQLYVDTWLYEDEACTKYFHTPAKAVTLKAKYKALEAHTVNFAFYYKGIEDRGSKTVTVYDGELVTAPDDVVYEYRDVTYYADLEYWFTSDGSFDPNFPNDSHAVKNKFDIANTPITEDVTLYAQYTLLPMSDVKFTKYYVAGTYQESYDSFGYTGYPLPNGGVSADETYTTTDTPPKKFKFLGWTIDGETLIDLNTYLIEGETTFIAKYEECAKATVKYEFVNEDGAWITKEVDEYIGDPAINVTPPANYTTTDTPPKKYKFLYYTLDDETEVNPANCTVTAEPPLVFKAKYAEEDKSTVTFLDRDGTTIAEKQTYIGEGVTPPTNFLTAYKDDDFTLHYFDGWYLGDDEVTDFSSITSDLTVRAHYKIAANAEHIVIAQDGQLITPDGVYRANDGTYDSLYADKDYKVALPEYTPTNGYNFGWFQAGSGISYDDSYKELLLTGASSAWDYAPATEFTVSGETSDDCYQGVFYRDIPIRTYDSATDGIADPENAAYVLGSHYFPANQTAYRIYYYNGTLTLPSHKDQDGVWSEYVGYLMKDAEGRMTYYTNDPTSTYYRAIGPDDVPKIECIFYSEGE